MGFIQASTRQMDRLLAGLLQVSRLGRVEIKPIRLDMNRVVAESLHALDFQLQSCSARVEVLPLPPCQGDLGQVSQVFTNLFGNAIKYHHPQRPLRLHISGSVQQGEAIYCVADNGIGIAANNQEKIFELFHRLDPQGSEGDGLGLTIVRTILDRLNGRVWVESRPEDGCRFYVALPSV
jgi:signal transduction histidine kinase